MGVPAGSPAGPTGGMEVDELRSDVAEFFGPGRFTSQAHLFDLLPGTAMDIRTGYDFGLEEDRERARLRITTEKPALLVGSPLCIAFSMMQRL
eukprot:5741859-Amphidinium_carterae.2